jgi:hypothetical protein
VNDHLPTALADIPSTPPAPTPAPFVPLAPSAASRLRLAAAAAAVTLLWAVVLVASQRFTISHGLHHPVVALHLISLTVGFGAVLAVDVCALNGLLRRHDFTLADALKAAAVVDPLIWIGYAGLIVSGLFLHPDLTEPLMWVKLAAGFAAGVNGLNANSVMRALSELPRATRLSDLPRPFAVRAVSAATFSQIAWWTAILIGFFGI